MATLRSLDDLDVGQLYSKLLAVHGRLGRWWPHSDTFAMPVSAVLVHQVTWRQVESSLAALREAGALTPEGLLALAPDELQQLIRPTGFMKAKSAGLRALAAWTIEQPTGPDPARCGTQPTARGPGRVNDEEELRASLLALPTVGPETADVICLYRYHQPRFIADAYARRLLANWGFAVPRDYQKTQTAIAPAFAAAGLDAGQAAELHGLIVEEGKRQSGK